MPLLKGSLPGLSASLHVFCLLVAPQTLAGQKFLEVEKRDNHLLQDRDCMEDARKFPSWAKK